MATPSRDPRAVLSHAQFYRLCEWVRTADADGKPVNLKGVHSKAALARRATEALKFQVSEHSVGSALDATGLVLVTAAGRAHQGSGKHDRVRVVARELAALLRELGKEPSEALMVVVHGHPAP